MYVKKNKSSRDVSLAVPGTWACGVSVDGVGLRLKMPSVGEELEQLELIIYIIGGE